MSFNGSGTFVRVYNWTTDAANSVKIRADRMDGEDNGFATGLSLCVTRDGQSAATANLPMGGFKHTGAAVGVATTDYATMANLVLPTDPTAFPVGTVSLPSLTFAADLNTGIYHPAADQVGITAGGALIATFANTKASIGTAFTVTAGTILSAGSSADVYIETLTTGTGQSGFVLGANNVTNRANFLYVHHATTPYLQISANTTGSEVRLGSVGVVRRTISSIAETVTLPQLGPDGSAAAPSRSYSADTDTGTYRPTTNQYGISTTGALRMLFEATGDVRLQGTPTVLNDDGVGFRGSPINTQDATYTLVLTDSGKTIYHTSGSAHTWTIPANASVAYPIGTIIRMDNENGGGAVTIAITSDTLRFAALTGSRTLSANGTAFIEKMTATSWRMTGVVIT